PTMIWLTKYLMVKIASSQATITPAMGAAISPTHRLPDSEATTPDRNAPNNSWPSMAMLMTPERSPTMPHSAPKMNGTARASAPCSRPVREIAAPPTAQDRNDSTNRMPNTIGSHSGVRLPLLVSQNA